MNGVEKGVAPRLALAYPSPCTRSLAGMLSRFDIAGMTTAPSGVGAAACMRKAMMIITDPPGPERQRAS
jgi:hypothetical protein